MKEDQLAIHSLITKNRDNNQQVIRFQEIAGTDKLLIKNREAVFFKIDNTMKIHCLYIKKGLLGWYVRGAYDFEGQDLISVSSDPVHYYFLTLEKSLLLHGIYNINHVRNIQIDDEQPETCISMRIGSFHS